MRNMLSKLLQEAKKVNIPGVKLRENKTRAQKTSDYNTAHVLGYHLWK